MIHCHIAPSAVFYDQIVSALSCERVRVFNYYFDTEHAVSAEVRVRRGLCKLLFYFLTPCCGGRLICHRRKQELILSYHLS